MMSEIKDAVDRGFFWLGQQKPYEMKEISHFYLACNLWKKDNQCLNLLNDYLRSPQEQNIRDIARAMSSASVAGIKPADSAIWIEEQQNQDGSWGESDVYDTTYALTAIANVGKYNPSGCMWLLENFTPKWEHPGTVALIITALASQGKTGNSGIYNNFINQKAQWLRENEECEGGWKYIATTTIVIDALISAENPDSIHNAVKWILEKQNPDGSWGKGEKKKNTTAMVLACFAKIKENSREQSL